MQWGIRFIVFLIAFAIIGSSEGKAYAERLGAYKGSTFVGGECGNLWLIDCCPYNSVCYRVFDNGDWQPGVFQPNVPGNPTTDEVCGDQVL